jgi:hypothetical protein
MSLTETECESVDCIQMGKNMIHWCSVVGI